MTSLPVFLSPSSATICPTRSFYPPSDFWNLSPPSLSTDFAHFKLFGFGLKLFITFTFLFLFYLRAPALQALVLIRLSDSSTSSVQHLS